MRPRHLEVLLVVHFIYTIYGSLLMAQADTAKTVTRKLFLADSLKQNLKADSLKIYKFQKIRTYIAADNRSSFIRSAPVEVYGFHLGVILKERHTLCLGASTISEATKRPSKIKDIDQKVMTNQFLTLNYLTLFYQYTLIDKRYFELDIPLEIGYGKYEVKAMDSLMKKVLFDRHYSMVPLGAAVNIVLKPLKWIGFTSMVGYRYVFDFKPAFNFNGWYYSYGVWIDLRQILRDTKFYLIKKPGYKKNIRALNSSH